MNSGLASPVEDPEDEIASLIRDLSSTHQRLQELAGGEVDAVVLPSGHSYLLHEVQEKLRHSEKTMRGFAATQSSILNALPAEIALPRTTKNLEIKTRVAPLPDRVTLHLSICREFIELLNL